MAPRLAATRAWIAISSVIAIAANGMVRTDDPQSLMQNAASFATVNRNTAGRIDMDAFMSAVTREQFVRMDPLQLAGRLAHKNVLLIGADDM